MSIAASRNASLILFIALLVGATLPGCQSDDPTQPVSAAPGTISVAAEPASLTAPWFLLRSSQLVQEGSGADVLEGMPSGDYSLVWGAVNGWRSPNPNPSNARLAGGGEISFTATYEEFAFTTGSIAIDTNPDEIDAPWTLRGPSGFMTQGTGDVVLEGREPGQYVLEFGSVPNYDNPGTQDEGMLEAGSRLDLGGNYVYNAPPSEGAIQISVSPQNASWTISGPGLNTSGTGSAVFTEIATGPYMLEWQDLSGWITPEPVQVNRSLEDGETELFMGIYQDPNGPVVDPVANGVGHGDLLTITGSGFGSHTLDVEWTGDWIESQADGTNPASKQGWKHVYGSQGPRDHVASGPHVPWSGSKYIDVSVDQTAEPFSWESTLGFEHNGSFQKIWLSFWIYVEPLAGAPQSTWDGMKFVQFTVLDPEDGERGALAHPTNSINTVYLWNQDTGVGDHAFWDVNAWLECPGRTNPMKEVFLDAVGNGYDLTGDMFWINQIKRDGRDGFGACEPYIPEIGQWTRCEFYIDTGDVADAPSGEMKFAITEPTSGRFVGFDASQVVLRTARNDCRSAPNDLEQFVFYLFWDDPQVQPNPNIERATILLDDVYAQFGTRARVEIGDRSTYASCTRLEVQVPQSWSSNQIQVQVNQGAFSPGSDERFLFVVREDGAVSEGIPVTLGN